ncbi:hypothetical protein CR513_11966, partial [Mucuna pruriens]
MVNEVGMVDNLRLQNQLTEELKSLVRQLVIGKHQPSIAARVCGICTFVEHPTDMCPTLQETESDHPESVGSIGGYQYGKQPYRSKPYDTVLVESDSRAISSSKIRIRQGVPQGSKQLSIESEIPSTIIPTAATTKSAITVQLTIFRGPNEAASDKQPGVSTDYELQQHAILAKFKCHDPRPQNAANTSASSGNLRLQTIPNPRGNARVVSLRSGKKLPLQATPQQKPRPTDAESKPNARSVPLPFPTWTLSVRKAKADEDLLRMFWKVEINIPLLDAIKQIPKYTKFLKELCVHKRKKMKGGVELGGVVSALIINEVAVGSHKTLPKKCRDPRIFSIPCTIGECTFVDAMLDLGASISVISIVQPLGVLEDVLVQVNELIFSTDFYVLDMEDETSGKGFTLILGRPFLIIARTKIDEEKLLQVLRQHKKAIRWRLSNLPGINPSIYMHKILMEEEACPIRQQ